MNDDENLQEEDIRPPLLYGLAFGTFSDEVRFLQTKSFSYLALSRIAYTFHAHIYVRCKLLDLQDDIQSMHNIVKPKIEKILTIQKRHRNLYVKFPSVLIAVVVGSKMSKEVIK